eukprot:scaffold264515_cov31-Tisochrysis_lutea.AAC.3
MHCSTKRCGVQRHLDCIAIADSSMQRLGHPIRLSDCSAAIRGRRSTSHPPRRQRYYIACHLRPAVREGNRKLVERSGNCPWRNGQWTGPQVEGFQVGGSSQRGISLAREPIRECSAR